MKLGFIINDEHPLLQTISFLEIKTFIRKKPLLIVGAEKAHELFPNFSFENKIIDKQNLIFYCFSELESKNKHEEALNKFVSYCVDFHFKNIKIITVYKREQLFTLETEAFVYETNTFISITTKAEIFYINKEIYYFINKVNFNSKLIQENLSRVKLISWDKFNYFGSYLKPVNQYITLAKFKKLYSPVVPEIYLGSLCLKWFKELDNINCLERSLWQRAYHVENYLSTVKIKINKEKLKNYAANESNTLIQTIYSNSCEGYINQFYNGTDKITGRIYAMDCGFSLQTLTSKFRDIIIAEKDCILVEIDYNYFEYDLLSQICGFKVNEDPHLYLSEVIFGDKEHREIAKTINYGFVYGMLFKNIIKNIKEKFPETNIDENNIKEKLKNILEPIKKLKKRLNDQFKEKNYIFNFYKRRIVPEKEWAYVNNYIQSTAADFIILKIDKLIQLFEKYSPDNKIILQKHDSILFNLNIEDINNTDILKKITEILNNNEEGLKATFKLSYGFSYGSMK